MALDNLSSFEIAPDSVRVWRGFRLQSLELATFYSKLGTVFIPATVKFQIDAGLLSYTPTVPAGLLNKPDYVPDETAILFWGSQETYFNGFTRLAVRTYTLTHNGVYITNQQPMSRADFPKKFTANSLITDDQPVFLFDAKVDWMKGAIRHLIAERPRSVTPEHFKNQISESLNQIQGLSDHLLGAIACVGEEYLVYWELGPIAVGQKGPVSGIDFLKPILNGWKYQFNPAPTFLPISIYDEWSGMDVVAGSSFNMQFERAQHKI